MTGKPQTCTHQCCTRKPVARRLCNAHYQAAWKAGELTAHAKLPPREKKHDYVCPDDHRHAARSTCFIQHQCRCTPCVEAHNARERNRKKQKAYGRFDTGLVDVAPVREHVLRLGEFGIGYKRVAQLAGFKSSTPVRTIIWGRQDPGPRFGEMQKRVKRETAEKILAIQPVIENLAPGQKVPAAGAHRRIQALVVAGWSMSRIAQRLGVSPANFSALMRRDMVLVSTWVAARDLFAELWDQEPPRAEWRDKIAFSRARHYGESRGWLPALAWDDIDNDPAPATTEVSEQTKAEQFLEDVEWLLEAGEPAEQVAASLGRSVDAIAKLAERNDRLDLARPFYVAAQRRGRVA
jgi:AraC-like DNA-binding protein